MTERAAAQEGDMTADEAEELADELADAKAEIERLKTTIAEDMGMIVKQRTRYEAVVEAAREFIKYVDAVNQRPMVEGSMLGAATAQAKLRAALAALEEPTQDWMEALR